MFTNTTISKVIVMPSLPMHATAVFNQNIPEETDVGVKSLIHQSLVLVMRLPEDSLSGIKAVIKQDAPATKLAVAKGSRLPMRSMVKRMRKAAGNSTRPEMRKSM